MRRLPLILSALALLVALAGPVTAGVRQVTNPMSADLDANHFSILNGSAIYGETFQSSTGYGVGLNGNVVFNDGASHLLAVTACAGDPSVSGLAKAQGSLCLSVDGLYRKTGAGDFDWARLG